MAAPGTIQVTIHDPHNDCPDSLPVDQARLIDDILSPAILTTSKIRFVDADGNELGTVEGRKDPSEVPQPKLDTTHLLSIDWIDAKWGPIRFVVRESFSALPDHDRMVVINHYYVFAMNTFGIDVKVVVEDSARNVLGGAETTRGMKYQVWLPS